MYFCVTEGKILGFGFVQFSTMEEAKKAVEEMNTKKILGNKCSDGNF